MLFRSVAGRAYANETSVETKTTANSASDWDSPAWPSGDAEVRICRIGATFTLYKRTIGDATWTLAATYQHPEMPSTIQVGACAYASAIGMSPDLRVAFDEIRFRTVVSPTDCTR